MEELQIKVVQQPAEISLNFDEIKTALAEQMEAYKTLAVTENVLAERKKDVATLRKISKAIEEKRKDVKRSYMEPYEAFERKAKELVAIVQEPIDLIDSQVREFDEKRKAEKLDALKRHFDSVAPDGMEWEKIKRPQWSNISFSTKDGIEEINAEVQRFQSEIETIKMAHSEVEEQAIKVYLREYRLVDALAYMNQYEAQKKIALENERKREEERQRAEQERRLEEERKRIEEEVRRELDAKVKQEEKKEEPEEIAFPGAEPLESKTYAIKGTEEDFRQLEMYLNSVGVEWREM